MLGSFRIQPILLAIALMVAAASLLLFGHDASANPKDVTSMQVPRGATVEIDRQGTARVKNSNGETGTFDCRCSGANATGTCVLGRGSSTIICGDGGSSCTGTCKLYTTTKGLSGGGGLMMKR